MSALSVAIITKNEEANIEECLRSVSFADEVVVVDSGSTDRTVEISLKYTDRVHTEPWQGSFSAQKQLAVDLCQGPWILVVDADERVPEELREEILGAMGRAEGFAGYEVGRRNHFGPSWIRGGGWYPDLSVRLFLKERGRFGARLVHEKVEVDGPVARLSNTLVHYTYRNASDYVLRMDRYSNLAAQELLESGKRPTVSAIVLRPLYTFFKMYVLKAGFRDGIKGFFLAASYAYYTLLKYFKLKELTEGDG